MLVRSTTWMSFPSLFEACIWCHVMLTSSKCLLTTWPLTYSSSLFKASWHCLKPGRGTSNGHKPSSSQDWPFHFSFTHLGKKLTMLKASSESWAADNLINKCLINSLSLTVDPPSHPYLVSVLDSQSFSSYLQLGHHTNCLSFCHSCLWAAINGGHWLKEHYPWIDWFTRSISVWDDGELH